MSFIIISSHNNFWFDSWCNNCILCSILLLFNTFCLFWGFRQNYHGNIIRISYCGEYFKNILYSDCDKNSWNLNLNGLLNHEFNTFFCSCIIIYNIRYLNCILSDIFLIRAFLYACHVVQNYFRLFNRKCWFHNLSRLNWIRNVDDFYLDFCFYHKFTQYPYCLA